SEQFEEQSVIEKYFGKEFAKSARKRTDCAPISSPEMVITLPVEYTVFAYKHFQAYPELLSDYFPALKSHISWPFEFAN
ncbi:hypothetical protein Y032_0812g2469, partial [Ancylostoma ceylanicum]